MAKFIFPPIGIGICLVVAFLLATNSLVDHAGAPPPTMLRWLLLGSLLVAVVVILATLPRFKRVAMDDTSLYISNYRREIVVPLRDVASISENRWIRSHPVTIHLDHDTPFGRQIVFMPTLRAFAFHRSHPIVAELRTAVARALTG